MTNGARHGLGVLVGVVATPLLLAWFALVANRFIDWQRRVLFQYVTHGAAGKGLVLILVFLVLAAVLGALCAPRLSPLASLVPGVVLVVVNGFWLVQPRFVMLHVLRPSDQRWMVDYTSMLSNGLMLLAGGVLIALSVAPSRWRGGAAPVTAGPPMAFSGVAGPGAPGPGMHGQAGPGMPGSGMGGPGAMGPGASPGPFGQPPAYPPHNPPGTPPAAPPPA